MNISGTDDRRFHTGQGKNKSVFTFVSRRSDLRSNQQSIRRAMRSLDLKVQRGNHLAKSAWGFIHIPICFFTVWSSGPCVCDLMPATRQLRQIYVKFGTDILKKKNLSDKREFRENRLGDTRALLKGVK